MKLFNSIIAVFLIFAVLALTACPKAQKTVRTLREDSAKLSIYGQKIVQANIDALKAGEISQDLFNTLTGLTRKYTDALRIYRAGVAEAEVVYKNTQELPTSTVDKLTTLLDVVTQAFTDLTVKLNLLSGSQAEIVKNIVASIQVTMLALRGAFSGVRTYTEANQWA